MDKQKPIWQKKGDCSPSMVHYLITVALNITSGLEKGVFKGVHSSREHPLQGHGKLLYNLGRLGIRQFTVGYHRN